MEMKAGLVGMTWLVSGVVAAAAPAACVLDRDGLLSPAGTGGSTSGGNGPMPSSGGMGGTGAGGNGGAGAMGGSGGSLPVVEEWVAGTPLADGTLELATWMTFVSPSSDKTAQTGADTVRTGFGANQPRGRNVGAGWGLSVESARTNVALHSATMSGGPWAAGAMTMATGVTDPSGGTGAVSFSSPGNSFSNYATFTGQVFSVWTRGQSGGPPFSYFVSTAVSATNNTSWSRKAVASTIDQATSIVPVDTRSWGALPAIVTPTVTEAWGMQVEPGARYASSYIPTTDASATREAERLYINDPETLFGAGFHDVELLVVPRYASGQLADGAEHDLLYFDAQNRTFLRRASSSTRLCQTVAGAEVCTQPMSFQGETALTVQTQHLPSGRLVSVAGVDEGTLTETPAPQAAVTLGPSVELLGNGLPGAQECSDLRRVTITVVP